VLISVLVLPIYCHQRATGAVYIAMTRRACRAGSLATPISELARVADLNARIPEAYGADGSITISSMTSRYASI
jgi:hypothetical protein